MLEFCYYSTIYSPRSLLLGLWAISSVAVNAVRLTQSQGSGSCTGAIQPFHCPLSTNYSNSSERSEDTEEPSACKWRMCDQAHALKPPLQNEQWTSARRQVVSISVPTNVTWLTVVFDTPTNGMKKCFSTPSAILGLTGRKTIHPVVL